MEDYQVMEYYNNISEGYPELYHKEQISKMLKATKYIPTGKQVLDIGSGDGILSKIIKNKIIALDISFNMLKNNPSKTRINANARSLPFKDESIEVITSFTMIQDITRFSDIIEEIWRILKKEGITIISYLKRSNKAREIEMALRETFKIIEIIEEEKDLIFICAK